MKRPKQPLSAAGKSEESALPKTGRHGKGNGKLGTFSGVFTPSVLTILGIILFMRLGYVVGAAGLKKALLIILIANLISVLTSFSLSAIATNLNVRGGGDYYLISRTLGVEFGGALGLVLFLAQAISIAFYCIGFGEIVSAFWLGGSTSAQLVALAAIALLFVLAWQGADWATRFQYLVMIILVMALTSFFIGGFSTWNIEVFRANWQAGGEGSGFWIIFAVFFPAVTGFTQGVSMSGDLRDPGKSLPLGTFSAVGLSIIVYFVAALVLAGTLEQQALTTDYKAMNRVAWFPFMITLGVFAATLSSAMASFLGAPRILQSLAADRIFPFLNLFAKGSGANNNPRRATVLALLIAMGTVSLGNLNLIARVVAMFFLISYGLLNYATYFEARAASPSFRPRFKWFHKNASLAGAFVCLGTMLAIDWKAGALAVAVLYIIHQYLQLTVRQSRWADSRRSYLLQQIREHLLEVSQELEHPRDWRPHILAFSDDRDRRPYLLEFASWIEGRSGLISVVRVLEGSDIRMIKQKQEAEAELSEDIAANKIPAFPLVVVSPDFRQGSSVLLQSFGVGPIRANMILLNSRSPYSSRFFSKSSNEAYGKNLRAALRLGYNLVILDAEQAEWDSIRTQPAHERQIDIWYQENKNGSLMLLLGYLMTRHPLWEEASLRVLVPVGEDGTETAKTEMLEELEQVRIAAEVEVVTSMDKTTLHTHSAESGVVFVPVALRKGCFHDPSGTSMDELLPELPITAMVLAAEDIQLDTEPESGDAGLLAEAEDACQAALKRVENAEKEQSKAQEEFDEQLHNFIEYQKNPETSEKERGELKNRLDDAKSGLRDSTKYLAKAESKAELAMNHLEELKKDLGV